MTKPLIYCAIDKADYNDALEIAKRVVPYTKALKLGMTFFNQNGPEALKKLMTELNSDLAAPASLFIDLKSHDIPMQVAGAVRSLIPLDAAFLTVHASGGHDMMAQAAQAADKEAKAQNRTRPKILGITVLTSLDENALANVGQGNDAAAQVLRLAKLAKEAGLDGVVCSPNEVSLLRAELGDDFILMVPGVRPAGSDKGDQARVMTPEKAVEAGATHLVIGRPITGSDDPEAVVQYIQNCIEQVI
jgi:orotidine-5'-phosphate decarboxylase